MGQDQHKEVQMAYKLVPTVDSDFFYIRKSIANSSVIVGSYIHTTQKIRIDGGIELNDLKDILKLIDEI